MDQKTVTLPERAPSNVLSTLSSGKRARILKNNLTAYLFLTPAATLIFTFGIFPIFYAVYVSMFKWRIKQGEYRGLDNFVSAMGNLAYIFFGLIVFVLIFMALQTTLKAIQTAQEKKIPLYFPAAALIPGGILGSGLVMILLRFITFFTQEQAIKQGHAKILGSLPIGIGLLVVGGLLGWGLNRWQHKTAAPNPFAILPSFITPGLIVSTTLATGITLAYYTVSQIQLSENAAVIWEHVTAVVPGLIFLALAYWLWSWSMNQMETLKTVGGLAAAAGLIGAGVYLIGIWPSVKEGSDPDFFLSFTVTIFYAMLAVPSQLGIALVLAYLLFQDIKFKSFFRIVFFIPYIAPTVAGAAVFQVLFSLREQSIANRSMQFFTGNPELQLRWLKEPSSFISVIGESFGLESVGSWEGGPSLALIVVVLFSIWRFVGYDTVIFLAGLGGIPGALYEAAKIDGANRWQLFRYVTLPLLSPTTFFLSVISVLGTFKAFNSIWVLRDVASLGTVETASIYFFQTFQRGARFGYAASMAIVLFTVMLTLTIIQNRIAAKRVFYG